MCTRRHAIWLMCILLHRKVIHPRIWVECRCLLRPRHSLGCLLRNRMVVIGLDWNEGASGRVVDEMLISSRNNLLRSWLLWLLLLLWWWMLLRWLRHMHLGKDISRWDLCCRGSCSSVRS